MIDVMETLATQDHSHDTRSKRNKMGHPQRQPIIASCSVGTVDTNNENPLKTTREDALEKETKDELENYEHC